MTLSGKIPFEPQVLVLDDRHSHHRRRKIANPRSCESRHDCSGNPWDRISGICPSLPIESGRHLVRARPECSCLGHIIIGNDLHVIGETSPLKMFNKCRRVFPLFFSQLVHSKQNLTLLLFISSYLTAVQSLHLKMRPGRIFALLFLGWIPCIIAAPFVELTRRSRMYPNMATAAPQCSSPHR
jgi:hypothetical protein